MSQFTIEDHGNGSATILHGGRPIGRITLDPTVGSDPDQRRYIVNGRRETAAPAHATPANPRQAARTVFSSRLAAGGQVNADVTERHDLVQHMVDRHGFQPGKYHGDDPEWLASIHAADHNEGWYVGVDGDGNEEKRDVDHDHGVPAGQWAHVTG